MKRKYYTVYLNKTDEIIAVGDSAQCAKRLHTTVGSFYSTVTNCKKGKNFKYSIVIDDMADSED